MSMIYFKFWPHLEKIADKHLNLVPAVNCVFSRMLQPFYRFQHKNETLCS